jgi:hypothetical protein
VRPDALDVRVTIECHEVETFVRSDELDVRNSLMNSKRTSA